MSGITEQLPALIGVIVGTAGTILATGLADRARRRRQQTVRWDERRLQAYVEYANAVKETHTYALRLAALDAPGSRLHRIDRDDGLARLAESDLRRTMAWESVLLLGDAGTVAAARDWREAVSKVEVFARGFADEDSDFEAAVARVNASRDKLYEAARASLDISAGSISQSDWLAKGFANKRT